MSGPERYPPSNSDWSIQEPPQRPPNLQQTSQQESHKFQALRDWNWFQSAPTSPWGTVRSYGGTGYVHHHCADMSAEHMASDAVSHMAA